MPMQITLSDFIKSLVAKLHKGKTVMPFHNERPWHLLFYELKKDTTISEKPLFLEQLRFDWDGPYPKSQKVSDFLQALHWNASVSASNPHYDKITLSDDVADLWQERFRKLDEKTKNFVDITFKRAQEEFFINKSNKELLK